MAWTDNFDLNKTATIKRETLTNDGMGGISKSTSVFKTVKCAIWMLSASERIQNDRLRNPSTHKIVIAPIDGIQNNDRITVDSDTFRITRPDNVREFGELQIIEAELIG